MDKSVPKKDPMTMPAVLAFEMAASDESRESEELDGDMLDTAGEACVVAELCVVESSASRPVDVGCGDRRQPQRRERSDGRMVDVNSVQEQAVYFLAAVAKDVVDQEVNDERPRRTTVSSLLTSLNRWFRRIV